MSAGTNSDSPTIAAGSRQSPPTLAAVPRATYRLQFSERFRLRDAAELAPYLKRLGVSHIYASPLTRARPHSGHGYDVVDYHRINPEVGSEEDLVDLIKTLRGLGMGLALDIVPNHMGIGGPENGWWWDVLTRGRASRYASYFDVDWDSPDPRLRGKVMAPVLHDRYARALERGELRVEAAGNSFLLRYLELAFPLCPSSLDALHDGTNNFNAHPEALDALIQRQHYYLTSWRRGDSELNYRRFFNVSALAGLRVEDEAVFNDSHQLVRQWVEAGLVDGLRVDHADGLRDPSQYLLRLRALAPSAWIIAEKILQAGESAPAAWPTHGTTGYDFLNRVGGLFIDQAGERPLTEFYAEFTGQGGDYRDRTREQKLLALRTQLAAEVNRLVELLVRVSARRGSWRDFTREELREAACEAAASLPVYRTYARPDADEISDADRARIDVMMGVAASRRPDLDPGLFAGLGELLRLRWRGVAEAEFVGRFQQLTGSAMAKGVEDTAFYRFNRLLALNEVGGDPGRFGLTLREFHEACVDARERCPHSALATTTHDTKRGEDTRARLSVLSELPEEWAAAVRRWSAQNHPFRRHGWPDRDLEYLFYQTLVGAWPLSLERALACVEKSAREAKRHTSWTEPNRDYEEAVRAFVTGALDNAEFVADLEELVSRLADPGYVNSLSQTLIKLTAPGVPDIYQGAERWDFSLVDPDNRRPVDFSASRRLLAECASLTPEEIWRRRVEGLPKLWLIARVLNARARHPGWFSGGAAYSPLFARDGGAENVVAFARSLSAITVAPRLTLRTQDNWSQAKLDLPPGPWRDELTGEHWPGGPVPVALLCSRFPVAFLLRADDP